MSQGPDSLEELQKWTLGAVTAAAPAEDAEVERFISASRNQSAGERLAVYRHAYVARLLGVMRELLPCTRYAVGDQLFDQFVVSYLEAHPPTSYTLGRLADTFAEYLDQTRPPDWGGFVSELARLEQAIDRVFDAQGPEGLPPFKLPEELSESLRLKLAPGAELLAFEYPVSTYFTAWKDGQAADWPQPRAQFVALLRRDYIVRRYELDGVQFQLLRALESGLTLSQSIESIVPAADLPLEQIALLLGEWFERWTSEQFFAGAF